MVGLPTLFQTFDAVPLQPSVQYRFDVCSAGVHCAVQEKVPGARGFSCFLPRLLSTPGIAKWFTPCLVLTSTIPDIAR